MDMQDKKFDQIFNQKFENFEEEPSLMVWDNITRRLDGKKANRSFLPWLSIAATILVVATASVLFLNSGKEAGTQNNNNKLIANRVKPTVSVKREVAETKHAYTTLNGKSAQTTSVAVSINKSRKLNDVPSPQNVAIPVDVTPADVLDHEPLINNQPVIVTLPVTQIQVTLPDIQLAQKTSSADSGVENQAIVSGAKQDVEPAKKRGIHSFGGLINAVVAKIDKRDDKVVEFSDGDGDDDNSTTLTGINLGLIKIKKQ
jgi:hypothetical protein